MLVKLGLCRRLPKTENAQNQLKARGNWLLVLSAHSPTLNLIEMLHTMLNTDLRRPNHHVRGAELIDNSEGQRSAFLHCCPEQFLDIPGGQFDRVAAAGRILKGHGHQFTDPVGIGTQI